MSEFQPQLIALKCGYTTDVPVVADLARQIKATDPHVPIVVGGHHISLSPQDLFTPEIDGIAYGEAEDIFPLIVRELGAGRSLERVPYVYYRKPDGDFGTTVIPQPVVNTILHDSHEMNARPMPQRSLCDPYRDEYYFLYHQQPYSVETSRGCRYRCSFCSVWQFHHGVYKVEGWQRTFDEIARVPDGSYINIVDDLAIQVMPHENYRESDAWKLAQNLIQSGNRRRFWMQCRADNIVRNKELYTAWAEAGLDMVLIGLESDDPAELKRVNKGSRVNVNEEAITFLHSVKVKVWGAQIVFADWLGDRFEHLMDYNKRLNVECPQFTIHTPLPGTVDWKKYYDQLITHDRRYFDFLHPVLPTALPIRDFVDRYVKLYRECHMSRSELMDMVRAGRRVVERGAGLRQEVPEPYGSNHLRQRDRAARAEAGERPRLIGAGALGSRGRMRGGAPPRRSYLVPSQGGGSGAERGILRALRPKTPLPGGVQVAQTREGRLILH